ncbi:MAG: single-stranded DNA-binding protein [Nostocaceae cyanobacterium]|nr:single-stranded DNA-binding protein [Nostocaceae cyanobacterium]
MNSCILMAEIIKEPQLRYTADNLEVTEMLVQFPSLREGEPPATLKVISWGNLAKEIQHNYHTGDRVILEGRLGMNLIERPEGFKEKRAELTVQKIHPLGVAVNTDSSPSVDTNPSIPAASPPPETTIPSYQSPSGIPTPAANNLGVVPPELPQQDFNQPQPQNPRFQPNPSPAVPELEPELDDDDIPF